VKLLFVSKDNFKLEQMPVIEVFTAGFAFLTSILASSRNSNSFEHFKLQRWDIRWNVSWEFTLWP